MSDYLFPPPKPERRPLSAEQTALLCAAGATQNEIGACENVQDEYARKLLCLCLRDAIPDNWRKLRCMVSFILWRKAHRKKPIGGDVITNTVKGVFDDCEGNNDHRLIFTRLVAIVRPDLRGFLDFNDGSGSDANAVLESGWLPPPSVNWETIKVQNWEVIEP